MMGRLVFVIVLVAGIFFGASSGRAASYLEWASNLNPLCVDLTIKFNPECLIEPGSSGLQLSYWKPAYFLEVVNKPFESGVPGMEALGIIANSIFPVLSSVQRGADNAAMMKEVHVWAIPRWLIMLNDPELGAVMYMCGDSGTGGGLSGSASNKMKQAAQMKSTGILKGMIGKLISSTAGKTGFTGALTQFDSQLKSIASKMALQPVYFSEVDPIRWRMDVDGEDTSSIISKIPGLCALTALPAAAKQFLSDNIPGLGSLDQACVGVWGSLKPRSGHSYQTSDLVHGAFVGYKALSNASDAGNASASSTSDKMQTVWGKMSECFAPGTPAFTWELNKKNLTDIKQSLVYAYWKMDSCCL